MLVYSQDKKRLSEHFAKDKTLFAYHLGDLDDFYFPHCQWIVDYGDKPRIREAILVYTGLDTPSVLAFGLTDDFAPLLREALTLFPKTFFCHFLAKHREIFLEACHEESLGTHLKMALSEFQPTNDSDNKKIRRLTESDLKPLHALYERAYPGHYFNEKMLATGKYFGWFDGDDIIGVAGIHVYSPEYRIAVLGNITVDPECRGRGIATKLISRLIEDLLSDTDRICLNVKADNPAAIASYKKLGFEIVCEYEEAKFRPK